MKNNGLMAILFFVLGLLLMWSGIYGRNPIRVVKEVLTNGTYGQWTEYKNAPPGNGPTPGTPGGTLHA